MGKLSLKKAAQDNGFADRLRELRIKRKLTQEELGEMVGIHFNHLGRYERGLSLPAADTLSKLAEALGVTGDYLLEGKTENAFKVSFSDPELVAILKDMDALPAEDKEPVKVVLRGYLNNIKIKALNAG